MKKAVGRARVVKARVFIFGSFTVNIASQVTADLIEIIGRRCDGNMGNWSNGIDKLLS